MDCFEREEGELLSDEELDDVSDNSSLSSTPILLKGKCSPLVGREPFRELSLTSVSDDSDDVAIVEQKCRLAKQTRDISRDITRDIRRRQCKHRRDVWYRQRSRRSPTPERRVDRRRLRKRYSSSPDSGHHYATHRTIYRQLRNAVRVNQSQHLPNISLRSRLKRLIPDSPKDHSDEEDLKILRDQALQSTKAVIEPDQNNSVTDEDLIQLRLDALHSAVLKKHQDRRKRKEVELKKLEEEKQIAAEEQKSTEILEDIAHEVTETVPNAEKNDAESIVISALQTVVQNHQERKRNLSVSAEAQIEELPPTKLPVEMDIQDDDGEKNLELLSALQTTVIINQQERKKRKSSSNEVQDQSAVVLPEENDITAAEPSVEPSDLVIFKALKTVVKKHEQRRKRKESFTELQSVALPIETAPQITVQPSIEVQNNDILKQLSALQTAVIKTHQNRRKRKSISAEVQPVDSVKPEVQENDATVQPIAMEHESPKSNVEEDEDILRAMLLTSISKKISNKKLTNNAIINNNKIPIRPPIPPTEIKVPVKIPKIGPVKRLIINVNSDTDSDCDHHTVVNNDIFDKSLSLFLQQARAKSESDHTSDIAKHLPRSQQLEYKRLKRKLQQLTTKPNRKGSVENKRIKLATNIQDHSSNRQVLPSKTGVNENKLNKAGRLQMKGKYEELAPLMARVTEAHNAREKAQSDVKRLINDLRLARTKLTTTHQHYTVLIQELVSAKSAIEKRSDDQIVTFVKTTPAICTSTPNKTFLNKDISCELSKIDKSIVVVQVPKPTTLDTCTTKLTEVPELKNIAVMNKVPVHQIIHKEETPFLKYTSPLDHIKCSEQSTSNPLLILCPYDLLGECRDQDCAYRHCGNNAP